MDFQCLSLFSKAEQLHMIPIELSHLLDCKYPLSEQQSTQIKDNRKEERFQKSEDREVRDHVCISMAEEFKAIELSVTNQSIPGLLIEKMDVKERTINVSFKTSNEPEPLLRLHISFPNIYPLHAPPSFTILQNLTGISDHDLKKDIVAIGNDFVCGKGANCLEPCLMFVSTKFVIGRMLNRMMGQDVTKTEVRKSHEPLVSLGSEYETYSVKPNDTLAAIALSFNMEKSELRKINRIHHTGQLFPGTQLIIKKTSKSSKKRLEDDYLEDTEKLSRTKRSTFAQELGLPSTRRRGNSVLSKSPRDSRSFHLNLEGTQTIPQKVISEKLKFLSQSSVWVSGTATLTFNEFVFEPDLDDETVKMQNQISPYTFAIPYTQISSCNTRPTSADNLTGFCTISSRNLGNYDFQGTKLATYIIVSQLQERIYNQKSLNSQPLSIDICGDVKNFDVVNRLSGITFDHTINSQSKRTPTSLESQEYLSDEDCGSLLGTSKLINHVEFRMVFSFSNSVVHVILNHLLSFHHQVKNTSKMEGRNL
eukprot:TRINITY_DN6129_c0_g4_i1.p1 TRINITY_DN6129_c0_g4~~TRINITY_DN6129_c0_g4_i1.p1  ORF type:complete len:535 (+),score=93.67 TRINITY_DN6129_c0_g4_i1:1007-2611(+)